jgi:hypothetical protein
MKPMTPTARAALKLSLLQIGLAVLGAPLTAGCCSFAPDAAWPVMPARLVQADEYKPSRTRPRPTFRTLVEVQAPQGPYQAWSDEVEVPFMLLPQFHVGATIHVRVNPEDRQDVEVVFCMELGQGEHACERYETHHSEVKVCR